MKKLINGNVIDIGQDIMDLFEKAAEGTMTKKKIMNRIDTTVESDVGNVGNIIEAYYRSYAALPYPLYAIEDEIKYATIAANMQRIIQHKLNLLLEIEIKDRIIRVHTESGYYLTLASEHWALENDKDNTELKPKKVDLSAYSSDSMYKFFKWCDDRLAEKRGTDGFYSFALPGLLSACNNKPLIVKWEMAKLLQFAELPEFVKLRNGKFLNMDTGTIYTLDCFWGGEYSQEVEENIMVIDCRSSNTSKEPYRMLPKRRKKYLYEVYEDNKETGRIILKKSKAKFQKIFETVMKECDNLDEAEYCGIIDSDYVALQVGNKIYTGKLGEELDNTGVGVKLLAMKNGRAYISKSIKKRSGAVRESIYIYDIEKDVLKVCDISYVKGEVAND